MSTKERIALLEPNNDTLSLRKQCKLLDISRSSYYYQPVPVDEYELHIMNEIDEIYTEFPYYGYLRITKELKRRGENVNKKRTSRLMQVMGIQGITPKKNLSKGNNNSRKYPYLLKGLKIERVNQVWGSDITYIRLRNGFVYLVAIMDWYSRYVLSWVLSNSLSVDFCLESLDLAFEKGLPEITNVDQGSQFTSSEYTGKVINEGARLSMDGRGRCFDNIFTERLWRSLKYEEVYIHDYEDVSHARESISKYFNTYNNRRLHSSLGYVPPAEVYFS